MKPKSFKMKLMSSSTKQMVEEMTKTVKKEIMNLTMAKGLLWLLERTNL